MTPVTGNAPFRFYVVLLAGLAVLAGGGAEAAGNAAAGARNARFCATCHGLDGNDTRMGAPRLAGKSEAQFIQTMHLFRTGMRLTHPTMYILTKNLIPQDVADLGAYYAAQKIRMDATPPPKDVAAGVRTTQGGGAR
jgi:cytochrome c553